MPALPLAFLGAPLAHRALHDVEQGRPENSRAAIRAAIEKGYGIEIDLQLSADGQAMVFHDYALNRLADDTGPVRAKTEAELRRTNLTGGSEGIPTLSEVLDLVAGRAALLIEIKDQDGAMGPNIGKLEEAAVRALEGYDGPAAFMSFNPHATAAVADMAPDTPRGIVTSAYTPKSWILLPPEVRDALREIPDFDRVGANFISHEVADLSRPRVAELKATGVPVLCWTVKSPEQETVARQVADNVTFEGYLAEQPA